VLKREERCVLLLVDNANFNDKFFCSVKIKLNV